MTLSRGLCEQLLTELLQEEIDGQPAGRSIELAKLPPAEAPDRFALHLMTVVERALNTLDEDDRVEAGVTLARELIERILVTANGQVRYRDKRNDRVYFVREDQL